MKRDASLTRGIGTPLVRALVKPIAALNSRKLLKNAPFPNVIKDKAIRRFSRVSSYSAPLI
jgi:hypothetical protein